MHNAVFNSNSLGHHNGNTVNAQFIASDLEYEVTNAITLQVIDVNKICNSAQVGPSTSWALVLCTCCTIHCYATAGPGLWNSLPSHMKDADLSYSEFRRSLDISVWTVGPRRSVNLF